MRVFSNRSLTRRAALLLAGSAIFLAIEFLDELTAGFPVVSLPLLRDGLSLSYQQVGLLLSAGPLSSALFEPIILLMSDRWSKSWLLRGALLCMAGGWALAGAAPHFWWLLLAVALESPATGAALGLGQAALLAQSSSGEARAMTRWTITGALGDLASPLAVAGLLVLGLGWQQVYWAAAGIWFVMLVIVWLQRFPRQEKTRTAALQGVAQAEKERRAEPSVGLLAGLRAALSDPILLRWAVAEKLCTMVDEIYLGFAALYLRDARHASASAISLALAIGLLGGLVGLLALDRLLKRHAGVRLLPWLALLSLAGVVGFLAAPVLWLAAGALFLFNLSAAGFYPITKAAAYSRLPGRAGTVQAVIALGEPFEIVLPVVVGFIAGQFGVLAALGFLGLAPLGIVLLAPRQAKKPA
ncbi:MAG TPA: MFS transporter [Ktedonobacterales bacterium]|nr:MFS transporter [Ktedonobacterales bacterium]